MTGYAQEVLFGHPFDNEFVGRVIYDSSLLSPDEEVSVCIGQLTLLGTDIETNSSNPGEE